MTDWNQFTANPMPKGAYTVDTRRFQFRDVSFEPKGKVYVIGDAEELKRNPVIERYEEQLAARLFVGLNVGKKPTWSIEDVVRITKRIRIRQTKDPSASFLAQKGIWRGGKRQIVTEDSVQIIILDTEGKTRKVFERQMVKLAETLAGELKQDAVYVEIQKNGMTDVTLKVVP